ncbi:MAG: hypothetical protein ACRECP_09305, partial [Methylocella sp.]
MSEPALPLPGPSRLAGKSLTAFGAGPLAPDFWPQRGMHASGRPILAPRKPWGALPWPPWRSTSLLVRDHAAWDTIFPSRARLFGSAVERLKVMSLSGSNDRPLPDAGNPVVSGAAGSGKAAERRRLAQALRANLGRRKAQKQDRMKQGGDAAESKT